MQEQNQRVRGTNTSVATNAAAEEREEGRSDEDRLYQSFLLRFWRSDPEQPWRISLQSTKTGDVLSFSDLQTVWSHIRHIVDADESSGSGA